MPPPLAPTTGRGGGGTYSELSRVFGDESETGGLSSQAAQMLQIFRLLDKKMAPEYHVVLRILVFYYFYSDSFTMEKI